MDRLERQRQAIRQVLHEHAAIARKIRDRYPNDPDTPAETIASYDPTTDNYLLVATEFQNQQRVYGILVHLRILDGKIHIERNNVESFIEDIIDRGISESDVVAAGSEGAIALAAAS